MPPRTPASTPTFNRVAGLPPGSGRPLPHNGLNAEEMADAIRLGYKPVDVRFEAGQQAVDLMSQGITIGTVFFNDMQMKAFEIQARLYKEQRSVAAVPLELSEDVVDQLASIGTSKIANLMAKKPISPDLVKAVSVPEPDTEVDFALQDAVRKALEGKV